MADPGTAPAIDGFDVVAYFTADEAVPGRPEHTVDHDGQSWLFASEENAQAFRASPKEYLPAYGGQCAFATSLGKSETGNPRHWAVRQGRLFLNSNGVAHLLWKVIPGRVAAADDRWGVVR